MTDQEVILDFWFGEPGFPEYGQPRSPWFTKDADFDQLIRSRFLSDYQQAARGELDQWHQNPQGCLALCILLDQFPRNLFRGTPAAFATDAQALATAKQAIAQGFDHHLRPVQRWFIYLPFEHSENLTEQQRSLQLWEQLRDYPECASAINYAHRHYEVIARFGRFPHRNAILGRESTPEELMFLSQAGASF